LQLTRPYYHTTVVRAVPMHGLPASNGTVADSVCEGFAIASCTGIS
jgi:hypothetical protein